MPSISFEVSAAAPVAKRILVSLSADLDLVLALFDELAQLDDRLARDDDARHPGRALGQHHFDAGEAVPVGGDRAQHRDLVVLGGVQVDAVQVVAGLFGRDREAGAVDQAAQLGGGQA